MERERERERGRVSGRGSNCDNISSMNGECMTVGDACCD